MQSIEPAGIGSDPAHDELKHVRVLQVPAPANGGIEGRHLRLELELRLPAPGWGFVNITGPLRAWSFTDVLPVAKDPHVRPHGMIRC